MRMQVVFMPIYNLTLQENITWMFEHFERYNSRKRSCLSFPLHSRSETRERVRDTHSPLCKKERCIKLRQSRMDEFHDQRVPYFNSNVSDCAETLQWNYTRCLLNKSQLMMAFARSTAELPPGVSVSYTVYMWIESRSYWSRFPAHSVCHRVLVGFILHHESTCWSGEEIDLCLWPIFLQKTQRKKKTSCTERPAANDRMRIFVESDLSVDSEGKHKEKKEKRGRERAQGES